MSNPATSLVVLAVALALRLLGTERYKPVIRCQHVSGYLLWGRSRGGATKVATRDLQVQSKAGSRCWLFDDH